MLQKKYYILQALLQVVQNDFWKIHDDTRIINIIIIWYIMWLEH